jgi:predicted nucleic acid-binding protein
VSHYVLDVSVGIKWLLPEIYSQIARQLLTRSRDGDIRLHVPDLFFAEAGNVIWKKARHSELQSQDAGVMFQGFLKAPVYNHPTVLLLPHALLVSLSAGIAIYDATYVALADMLECTVITADDRLRQKLYRTAWNKRIEWIADFH